jgi:hypothetical protein
MVWFSSPSNVVFRFPCFYSLLTFALAEEVIIDYEFMMIWK